MAKSDRLKKELSVAELEEQLIKAKGTAKGPSRDLKLQLREARRQMRLARQEEAT